MAELLDLDIRKANLREKQEWGLTSETGHTPLGYKAKKGERVYDTVHAKPRRASDARAACRLCGNPSRKGLCTTCGGTDAPNKEKADAKGPPIVQLGVIGKARIQAKAVCAKWHSQGCHELTQARVAALRKFGPTWAAQAGYKDQHSEIFVRQLIDFVGIYLP